MNTTETFEQNMVRLKNGTTVASPIFYKVINYPSLERVGPVHGTLNSAKAAQAELVKFNGDHYHVCYY